MANWKAYLAAALGGGSAAAIAASAHSFLGARSAILMALLWPLLVWRLATMCTAADSRVRWVMAGGAIGGPTVFFVGLFLAGAAHLWMVLLLWAMIATAVVVAAMWLRRHAPGELIGFVHVAMLAAVMLAASGIATGAVAGFTDWQAGADTLGGTEPAGTQSGDSGFALVLAATLIAILLVAIPQFIAVALVVGFVKDKLGTAANEG